MTNTYTLPDVFETKKNVASGMIHGMLLESEVLEFFGIADVAIVQELQTEKLMAISNLSY